MPKPVKSTKVEVQVHSNEEINELIWSDNEKKADLGGQWAVEKTKFYLKQMDSSLLIYLDEKNLVDDSEILYLTLLESSELNDESFLRAFINHFRIKRKERSVEDVDDDHQIVSD